MSKFDTVLKTSEKALNIILKVYIGLNIFVVLAIILPIFISPLDPSIPYADKVFMFRVVLKDALINPLIFLCYRANKFILIGVSIFSIINYNNKRLFNNYILFEISYFAFINWIEFSKFFNKNEFLIRITTLTTQINVLKWRWFAISVLAFISVTVIRWAIKHFANKAHNQ